MSSNVEKINVAITEDAEGHNPERWFLEDWVLDVCFLVFVGVMFAGVFYLSRI